MNPSFLRKKFSNSSFSQFSQLRPTRNSDWVICEIAISSQSQFAIFAIHFRTLLKIITLLLPCRFISSFDFLKVKKYTMCQVWFSSTFSYFDLCDDHKSIKTLHLTMLISKIIYAIDAFTVGWIPRNLKIFHFWA